MALPSFYKDRRFLTQIDNLKIKQQYIKITVLTWQEQPIQEVQGICISGNLNVSGDSSMRRTASLSILADEKNNNLANMDHLFAINKKCKLELGIKNTLPLYYPQGSENNPINYQSKYGDIVWFPLGLFIMFNPSISHGADGITISMNLKDKMCLLNGEVAGAISTPTNFSIQDEVVDLSTNQSIENNQVLIYDIIKQLVNHWGRQILSNIIISDVPLLVKKAVEWDNSDSDVYIWNKGNDYILTFTSDTPSGYSISGRKGPFHKGDVVGFKYVDFIYPDEKGLSCSAGQTVTSVLDKIVQVLGNFEYFYDVQGKFIFRQKRNFLNTTYVAYWNRQRQQGQVEDPNSMPHEEYNSNLRAINQSEYDFKYNQLVINFNNTLEYNNIKNDFVVWGTRTKKNASGQDDSIICRYHLAIDKKPEVGQRHHIELDKRNETTVARAVTNGGIVRVSTDWREQLYYQLLEADILGRDQNGNRNNPYIAYDAEMKMEFPKIFNLQTNNSTKEAITNQNDPDYSSNPVNYITYAEGWTDEVKNTPWIIEYFLDFIDSGAEIGKYSVENIGRRSKIIADSGSKINSVFEPVIIDLVFVDSTNFTTYNDYSAYINQLTLISQPWINVSGEFYNYCKPAIVPNSCYEKIKDLLYQHTIMNDTVSFSTLPIYYLQPNTLVTLNDPTTGIEGDYLIKTISVPLDISGSMNISAYKVFDKL